MKRIKILLILGFCFVFSSILFAKNLPNEPLKDNKDNMTLADVFNLDPSAWESKGVKLSWREKIAIKVAGKKIRQYLRKHPEAAGLSLSNDDSGCAKIVKKNGDIIEADIISITPTEVKYKRCGKPGDPEFVLSKKEVLSIMASDGEVLFRNTSSSSGQVEGAKNDPLAVASLVVGVSGLVIGLLLSGIIGVLAGIVGIVFGFIALKRIKDNPDEYKGKGMALAGLISGIVITALLAILIIAFL